MARPLALAGRACAALPEWIRPQLTKLVDAAPEGKEWLHEIKFDGYRMHARLNRGAVKLLTRTGLDWTHKYPPIAAPPATSAVRHHVDLYKYLTRLAGSGFSGGPKPGPQA
jgi:ATP-dependent DNA ligase